MNFLELADSRHSCRRFRPDMVEPDKMNHIYEAIRLAPTAGNLQAYSVRVVTEHPMKGSLAAAAWMQSFIQDAPVVLVFFAVPELSARRYEERGINLYCVQDATIACTYAQLAAHDLGLASCWIGAFDTRIVHQVMQSEWSWKPIAMLPIGYSDAKNLTSPPKSDRVQVYDSSSNNWRTRLW